MRCLTTGSRDFGEAYENLLRDVAKPTEQQIKSARRIDNLNVVALQAALDQFVKYAQSKGETDVVFVHGDCPRGADRIVANYCAYAADPNSGARQYAPMRISAEAHPADWVQHGKSAGPVRNSEMVDLGGYAYCIAGWDGKSKGTLHCLGLAVQSGIMVRIVPMICTPPI